MLGTYNYPLDRDDVKLRICEAAASTEQLNQLRTNSYTAWSYQQRAREITNYLVAVPIFGVESKGFWRRCITLGITGLLGFVRRPEF
jgi:hypothetical protein